MFSFSQDPQPGDAAAASAEPVRAHWHEQQQEPEPDAERETETDRGAQPAAAVVSEGQVLLRGQLAEDMGGRAVARHLRWPVHVEVHPVSEPGSLPHYGVLRLHCERGCRDSQVQHGSHPPPCLSKYHYLASEQDQARRCGSFR